MDGTMINENLYVIYKLGEQEYGIDIKKVITVEKMTDITRVPKAPEFIKGVINLRGDIVPVMSLRTRFNLPVIDNTDDTRIIIVKLDDIWIGLIVDYVTEVIGLTQDSIENVTDMGDVTTDYITGVGKMDDRVITIINIDDLVIPPDNNK